MTPRRIVSLWLPRFPIERWERLERANAAASVEGEAGPLALVTEGPHGPVVHALNQAAEALGLRAGGRLVDSQALCPELMAVDADPAAEVATLRRLAGWCRRWCPWTAVDGADGIVLDASGSAHLWGGETAMLCDMEARFARLGFSTRTAIAPSWGAAWALARYSSRAVCKDGDVATTLAPLPPESLRLDAGTVLLLRRLGLKTVGALAAVPRLSLARRFLKNEGAAANPLLRLDQAFGRLAEPVPAETERPPLRATRRLAEPAMKAEPLLEPLARDLCEKLERRGLGARRIRFAVFRVDGDVGTVEAATSRPSRDVLHLLRLLDGKFDALDPGFGFDAAALEALVVEPLDEVQARLSGEEDGELQLSRLVDRLVARLGAGAVTRPTFLESHVPERSEAWTSALTQAPGVQDRPPPTGERPLRLLGRPEEVQVVYAVPEGPPARFVWRRLVHDIVRHEGPERIAPEWWRERSGTRLRDYYRVEDVAGRRYWLFREGVAGDGRGGAPRWFLHGLFA
jgi:protein ImuB